MPTLPEHVVVFHHPKMPAGTQYQSGQTGRYADSQAGQARRPLSATPCKTTKLDEAEAPNYDKYPPAL